MSIVWNYSAASSLSKQREDICWQWRSPSAFARPSTSSRKRRSFMIEDLLKDDRQDNCTQRMFWPSLTARPPWLMFYHREPTIPIVVPQPISPERLLESSPKRSSNKSDSVPNYLRTLLEESRKHRRNRTVFSRFQMQKMEEKFMYKKYLSTQDRNNFAKSLCLTSLQLKTWYQNRRMKWKKEMLKIDPTAVTTRSKGRPRKGEF